MQIICNDEKLTFIFFYEKFISDEGTNEPLKLILIITVSYERHVLSVAIVYQYVIR